MDIVKSMFDSCIEIEHNIKADGTLSFLCRYCCSQDIWHKYTVYSDREEYDIITFEYKYDDICYVLHWLEEKSTKV